MTPHRALTTEGIQPVNVRDLRDTVRMQVYGPDHDWDRHFAETFARDGEHCVLCHELTYEAWERMTFGGVQVDKALHWVNDLPIYRLVDGVNLHWRTYVAR